jgi:hypothetical protein
MNAACSNPTFQYTMKTVAEKKPRYNWHAKMATIGNAAYCGKFMFTCPSHTIRITKPTFLVSE